MEYIKTWSDMFIGEKIVKMIFHAQTLELIICWESKQAHTEVTTVLN